MADNFSFSFERPLPSEDRPLPTPNPGASAVWGVKEMVIGFLAVFILFFVFATAIIYPVQAATSEESPESLAAQAVTVAIWDASMVLIVYYLVRRAGGKWRNLGLLRPLRNPFKRGAAPGGWDVAGFVVLAYFASITTVSVYGVVIDALGLDILKPSQQLPDSFFDHDYLVAMIGFAVVFAAPFAEEVFFRGFLFAGLRKRLPFVAAALISGAVFSLAHADPGLFIPFTAVGVILAFTFERTGSLYAAIGMHFIFNAMSFFALVFFPEARN